MMTLTDNGRKLLSPWAESDRNLMQGDDHRGGGRIMQELSESDKRYIQQQIDKYRYNTEALDHCHASSTILFQKYRENCLWRIASCAGLFDDLDPTGTLTDNQWNQAIDFVEQFQGGQH